MYIKISHLKETENLSLPNEVLETIKGIAKSLDDNYGKHRQYNDDGGYIIFADNKDDLQLICELEIDIEACTFEYAEPIQTANEIFINVLYLLNNEFAVTVIMPRNIAPKNILAEF